MKTSEERREMNSNILKMARKWADDFYESATDMAKAIAVNGFFVGYDAATSKWKAQVKAAWIAARQREEIDLGGGDKIEGRHARWENFEDWLKEQQEV